MEIISITTAIITGICLSACCGFRIFTPFFILSLCNYLFPDVIPLAESMQFICDLPALIGLGTATIIEILAFYIPWIDNLLGAIATPVAGIAGILLGALISDNSSIEYIENGLSDFHFYVPMLGRVFKAVLELNNKDYSTRI